MADGRIVFWRFFWRSCSKTIIQRQRTRRRRCRDCSCGGGSDRGRGRARWRRRDRWSRTRSGGRCRRRRRLWRGCWSGRWFTTWSGGRLRAQSDGGESKRETSNTTEQERKKAARLRTGGHDDCRRYSPTQKMRRRQLQVDPEHASFFCRYPATSMSKGGALENRPWQTPLGGVDTFFA